MLPPPAASTEVATTTAAPLPPFNLALRLRSRELRAHAGTSAVACIRSFCDALRPGGGGGEGGAQGLHPPHTDGNSSTATLRHAAFSPS